MAKEEVGVAKEKVGEAKEKVGEAKEIVVVAKQKVIIVKLKPFGRMQVKRDCHLLGCCLLDLKFHYQV